MSDSIDAAVALIPKGWRYTLTSDDWPQAPGAWGCELYGPKSYTLPPSSPEYSKHWAHGNGKSAASAIHAAMAAAKKQRAVGFTKGR